LGGKKMGGKLIRFDWAMKKILRDKENFVILEGFLSELLKDDIKIIEILESESNKEREENKLNRLYKLNLVTCTETRQYLQRFKEKLTQEMYRNVTSNYIDILAKDKKESYIIFEIQVTKELDYLSRILFGVSKVISERLNQGLTYKNVKKVYSINIVYFDLGHGEDYVYKGNTIFYGLHKKDQLKLNEQQKKVYNYEKVEEIFPEYYILKVEQFDDETKDGLDEWIYFLKNEKVKDGSKAKGLKEAMDKLNVLSMDETEKRKYDRYLDEIHYEASMVESSYGIGKIEGKIEGIKEGIEKGIKEGKIKIAENMKSLGMDIEIIMKATELSREEIEGIR